MRQYKELLQAIKERGTVKPPARANMPSTLSLFGYQLRHHLQEGFPLLTTKKINFKHIVVELLWFLKGDTNIKYLVDNGCNIWNEDAYNYYVKIASKNTDESWNNIYMGIQDGQRVERFVSMKVESYSMFTYEEFVSAIKNNDKKRLIEAYSAHNYTLGDCGKQYGWLWRMWEGRSWIEGSTDGTDGYYLQSENIDQIKDLIVGLKKNPLGRRHILTAWNPATLDDMALNACHAFVQFNCRPLTAVERENYVATKNNYTEEERWEMNPNATDSDVHKLYDQENIPKYFLDCHLYQRSADVFLGVPYNIASYALLTHIIAAICNMQVGDFIHSFGDVHIYENHMDAVDEQLKREERPLPTLKIMFKDLHNCDLNYLLGEFLEKTNYEDYVLENYNPHPSIKAELSTGLIK